MITITNYNSYNSNEPLVINPKLVDYYKEQCDTYLVNLKRELTRSLVDYHLFQQLQDINNSFIIIIDKLLNKEYIATSQLLDDYKILTDVVNIFQKGCYPVINGDIYESIRYYSKLLLITMNKLITTVKTINSER